MPHIPVDPSRLYKPMEITKYGFIVNTLGKPDYRYVLRLVLSGQLKSQKRIQGTKGKVFLVKGSDILEWKKSTVYKPEENAVDERYDFSKKPFPQAE